LEEQERERERGKGVMSVSEGNREKGEERERTEASKEAVAARPGTKGDHATSKFQLVVSICDKNDGKGVSV